MMDGQAIISVSAATVALVQLTKWSGLPDKWGPIAVLVIALMGVSFWAWSTGDFTRANSFMYFSGWISVATSAAGIFGFTRAGAGAIVRVAAPPESGAGSSPTDKETKPSAGVRLRV